jgi:hypothetical protein
MRKPSISIRCAQSHRSRRIGKGGDRNEQRFPLRERSTFPVSTPKEREIVEKAAGFGLPHDKICQLIVSERTGKPIGLYIGRRQGQRGEEYRQGTGGRSGLGRGVSDSTLLVAFVLAVLGAVLLIAAASW